VPDVTAAARLLSSADRSDIPNAVRKRGFNVDLAIDLDRRDSRFRFRRIPLQQALSTSTG
jgi:hypothetical protein